MTVRYRNSLIILPLLISGIVQLDNSFASTRHLSVETIHDLGVQSINGDDVPIDLVKGRYFIHQSALRGYPLGQYHLGILFYTGEGGKQSNACAKWWLEKASQGNSEVQEMAQQTLAEITEEIAASSINIQPIAPPVDEQLCIALPAETITTPPLIPAVTVAKVDYHTQLNTGIEAIQSSLKHAKPNRILPYQTSISFIMSAYQWADEQYRILKKYSDEKSTALFQHIQQNRENAIMVAAYKAHSSRQSQSTLVKNEPDEPDEVIITIVLPPSEPSNAVESTIAPVEIAPVPTSSKPEPVIVTPTTQNMTSNPPISPVPQDAQPKAIPLPETLNLGGDLQIASSRHYTVQIGSSSTPDGLHEQARRHKLSNYLVYETVRHGRQWYVMVYGEYPNISTAKKAAKQLPASIQQNKPWVRSLQHVQSELH